MSRLENGLENTVLTQSAKFFLPDTLKVAESTISTPKSYDEHPRQVISMRVPSPQNFCRHFKKEKKTTDAFGGNERFLSM